jgi:hypothetical protein
MSDDLPIQSNSPGLVERAKGILVQPKAEWPRVAAETTAPMKVLTGYVLPLAAIGPIAGLIGMQIFGVNVVFATVRPSLGFALTAAVTSYVLSVVGVFVLAFIANWLSPKFGGRDNFPSAFRLIAYAMTASWVGGIFGLVPTLTILVLLFGLYSLYLIYLGAGPVMGVPQDKTVGYTLTTVVAAIVLYIVVGVIRAAVTGTAGLAAGGVTPTELSETTIDMGELGTVTVDANNQTVDLGELGKVEIDGNTATVTVDGQTVEVLMDEVTARATAEAAAAR